MKNRCVELYHKNCHLHQIYFITLPHTLFGYPVLKKINVNYCVVTFEFKDDNSYNRILIIFS